MTWHDWLNIVVGALDLTALYAMYKFFVEIHEDIRDTVRKED